MDATFQQQTNYKAQRCEMETTSPAVLKDTVAQTGVPNEFSSEDSGLEEACIEIQLDYMVADGLSCDEEDEAILAFLRKSSGQRTLPEFDFTLKKSPDCNTVMTMTNSTSVSAPEPSRGKRQRTLQDFGFIAKRKKQWYGMRKFAHACMTCACMCVYV